MSLTEANDAFLEMVGYDREDLPRVACTGEELADAPEWRAATERALAELTATGTVPPYEKEYSEDGSRAPVLVGAATLKNPGTGSLSCST